MIGHIQIDYLMGNINPSIIYRIHYYRFYTIKNKETLIVRLSFSFSAVMAVFVYYIIRLTQKRHYCSPMLAV